MASNRNYFSRDKYKRVHSRLFPSTVSHNQTCARAHTHTRVHTWSRTRFHIRRSMVTPNVPSETRYMCAGYGFVPHTRAHTRARDPSPPYCVRVRGRTHTRAPFSTLRVSMRGERVVEAFVRECAYPLILVCWQLPWKKPKAGLLRPLQRERSRLSVAPSCIQPSKTEEHEGTFVLLCSVTVTAGYWEMNTAVKSGIFGKARFSPSKGLLWVEKFFALWRNVGYSEEIY